MSARHRPHAHVLGGLLCLSLTSLAVLACEEGKDPATPAQVSKTRPPDVTEVTMEVTDFDAGGPEPGAKQSAPASTGAPPSADPSEDPNIGGPQPAELEKSVAPIRARLRACYKKSLAAEPHISGSATFDATIGKDGKVASARFVKRDGLSEDMMGCLLTAVKAMTFETDRKSQVVSFSFGAPRAGASGAAGAGAASANAGATPGGDAGAR